MGFRGILIPFGHWVVINLCEGLLGILFIQLHVYYSKSILITESGSGWNIRDVNTGVHRRLSLWPHLSWDVGLSRGVMPGVTPIEPLNNNDRNIIYHFAMKDNIRHLIRDE